ncbi:MAG: hypothetical protein Q7U30_17710 [Methylicorpusculum sp.]|nr:hypothetical protein [Methylicorpusculum sp.]
MKKIPTLIKNVLNKTLALFLVAIRHLPRFAQNEYRQYLYIEKQLSQIKLNKISSILPSFLLNKPSIRDSLLRNSTYRVIDPVNMTHDDAEFIKRNSIFIEYIEANKLPLTGENLNDIPAYQEKDNYDRTFQLQTIKNRFIKAICPRTGVTLHSDRSLLPEAGGSVFYRFIGQEHPFYLAVGRAGMGYIKTFLYMPDVQTIILLGDNDWAWLGRWEIDQFRAYLISDYKKIFGYLTNQTIPGIYALLDQYHFAHHIWNTLTGLSKIATKEYGDLIDSLLITNEPMGPIDQLFPEFEKNQYLRLSNSEIVDFVIEKNLFVIRPGGTIVTDEIMDRIYRVAIDNTVPYYLKDAQDFRAKHWPILWATIRTGNRSWHMQAEGIANIANKFKKIYPNFALVVDGYAIPYGEDIINNKVTNVIANEEVVAQKIRDLLDVSIEVRFFVGKPIFQSVIYSRFIDVYLAHHGSIQHKIAWLSNKPGLVHSNKKVLSGIGGTKRYYAAFTSTKSEVLPHYLDPEIMTDISGATEEGDSRWDFALSHYDFDDQHAFDNLLKIVLLSDRKTV